MVDITTTTTGIPDIRSWSIPASAEESGIPRGEVVFAGVQTVPAKLAADINRWLLVMVLPRNWVYRLVELQVVGLMEDGEPMQEGQPAMFGQIISDAVNELDWFFTLLNIGQWGAVNQDAFPKDFAGQANDIWAQFVPAFQAVDGYTIDSSAGTGQVSVAWMDKSGDASAAWDAHFRFRFLMYDVRQVNFWPMHAPQPIIAS